MQNDLSVILRAFGKLLTLGLAVTAVALIIIYDVCIVGIDFSESTLIEMTQEIILPVCVLLFILLAKMKPGMKYTYYLIAGFFACMFIREMDFFFGRVGFLWIIAILLVACISVGQSCFFISLALPDTDTSNQQNVNYPGKANTPKENDNVPHEQTVEQYGKKIHCVHHDRHHTG